MDLGAKTIDWLYNIQLQVDDEWSVRTPTGFTWWADQNAQTIEVVGQDTGPDGQPGYTIAVRTEMLADLDLTDEVLEALNEGPMRCAAMDGPVYDEATRTLSLCSLVRVHPEIASWMRILISTAAVLQIAEARLLGPVFAEQFGARPAHSGHPQNGPRPEPDDMAFTAGVFLDQGKQPCMWPAEEFEESVKQYMLQPPAVSATSAGQGLAVEFPFGDQTSLCRLSGENPHPIYGNGLLIVQRFPLSADTPAKGVRMALDLNGSDLTRQVAGYGFGSYAYVDDMLCFTGFLPNPLRSPGLLPSIYFSCATRAHSMAIRLLNRPWT
ncbi:MAG TPA: hypothetical protein PLH92_07515 [Mycobacterium sp.]|uniref:hypothetical protein n=1 Tax=Mycolicibacterium sp. TaxID=2320850 RepID=UPI0025DE76BF|nr:hypothetical protein [Mycolicibacterium sp.]HPX37702.1 hypothetical protein [Mycobacterium sp.]HQC76551.1 hypothetical protein [Mycobacterium sp.]